MRKYFMCIWLLLMHASDMYCMKHGVTPHVARLTKDPYRFYPEQSPVISEQVTVADPIEEHEGFLVVDRQEIDRPTTCRIITAVSLFLGACVLLVGTVAGVNIYLATS